MTYSSIKPWNWFTARDCINRSTVKGNIQAEDMRSEKTRDEVHSLSRDFFPGLMSHVFHGDFTAS